MLIEDSGAGANAWLQNRQRIERINKGVFRVNPDHSLALQRPERGSLVRSEWTFPRTTDAQSTTY